MPSSCGKTLNVSKMHDIKKEGIRLRVLMETVYSIISKVFSCQEKEKEKTKAEWKMRGHGI